MFYSVVWIVPLLKPLILALGRPAISLAMMEYVDLVLAVSLGSGSRGFEKALTGT